jgi:hypothetical protein
MLPVFFMCVIAISFSFLGISVYGYVADCLGENAPEAYATINLANLYTFGKSLYDFSLM